MISDFIRLLRGVLFIALFVQGAAVYAGDGEAEHPWESYRRHAKIELTDEPTDLDLRMVPVFEEPLVPIGEEAVAGENAALALALKAHVGREANDDFQALERFIEEYPESRWRVAVQVNLGLLEKKTGYFTSALERLEDAWARGKSAADPEGTALANRALGELADLNARFGRFTRMKELFDEASGRDIAGSAQTQIVGAREGYWKMTEKPEDGFRCGPFALNAVINAGKPYLADPEISREPSTQLGTSLDQLKKLAERVGANYQPVKRSEGAEWIVPSVVHWKVGHFAAITRKMGGHYLIQDPTFGGEIWVTADALNTEATGYALVSGDDSLPEGWAAISDEEAAGVWGKGGAAAADPEATNSCNSKTKGCPGPATRMAQYNIFKMLATLTISDAPVGYAPPVGPGIEFFATYNHLEAGQPANFQFANFGPSWVSNWVSYATVDSASGNVAVILRGGGTEVYDFSEYDALTNRFGAALYSGAVLRKKSDTTYEREMADGSREVYSKVQGTTGRIFLTEVIDSFGNKVTLAYDANFRLTTVTDALGQNTTVTYKSNTVGNAGYFKIYRVTDPFSRYAEFTYDAGLTRLEKIRDVIGIESAFLYGENGFITKMTTPYGATQFYQYVPAADGTGRGLLAILPDGSREVVERYTGHEKKTYYWDRKAMAMAPGDPTKAEQTQWMMSGTGYLMMDIPEWTKKALEDKVFYDYPGEQTIQPDPVNEPEDFHNYIGTTSYASVVRRSVGGTDQIYQYAYNILGRMTETVDPLGRKFELKYSANNLDLYEVRQTRNGDNDLLGKVTLYEKHQPRFVKDASGNTTEYTYNASGQVATVTNAKGEVTTFNYTGGYLTSVDGPLSGNSDRVEFTYDSAKRVRTVTRIEGPNASDQHTLTYDYDALDRVTKVTYPDGTWEEAVYDRLDLKRQRDRLGRWTTYEYSPLRQVIEERDPAGRVTNYEWCRCGALQGLTDPMGRVTKWAYDVQGRFWKKTYPDSSTELIEYDAISRVKKVTDTAGNVRDYTYNLDNSVQSVAFTPASGFAAASTVSYTYDPNYPRIATVGNGYGTYTHTYKPYVTDFYGATANGRGKVESIANSALGNSTIAYTYDELGRMTGRTINGSANEASWAYDAAGRLSSWTNPLGTFTPTYQNAAYGVGRMASLAFPNGNATEFQWEDNAGDFRLEEIKHLTASSNVIAQYNYVTNAIGNIVEENRSILRYNYGYDAVDQLTSVILRNSSINLILAQYYYGYDKAANRTSEQTDSVVKSATYNNLNQLTLVGGGGPTRFKGTLDKAGFVKVDGADAWMSNGGTQFQADVNLSVGTHTVAVEARNANNVTQTKNYQVTIPSATGFSSSYDGAGNLTTDGSKTYTWDALNRLVEITYAGGASSEFSYDALGRRVKIVEKNASDVVTETRNFIWDGMEIAERRDASNALVRRYYADGFATGTSSSPSSLERFYYFKDHLGSIRHVIDSNGISQASYEYDPFGREIVQNANIDSDFRYTGHYYHETSHLILAPYRAYDPELGRWLSRDPIGERGGINLYGYVSNNPANWWDPLGLCTYGFSPTGPAFGDRPTNPKEIDDALDKVSQYANSQRRNAPDDSQHHAVGAREAGRALRDLTGRADTGAAAAFGAAFFQSVAEALQTSTDWRDDISQNFVGVLDYLLDRDKPFEDSSQKPEYCEK